MAADVNSNLASWSTSEASNSPSGSTAISTNLDDNLRQIQATVRTYLATKASDIASGSTVDLSTVAGSFVDVTGTTTITSFGTLSAGMSKILQFDGALTLTHNATSLILPGGANITTAAGDCLYAVSLGSGNWVVPFYQPAAGNVTITGTQTLTNKTLTSPTINSATIATATITGGTLTSPVINTGVTGTAVASQAQQETGTATDLIVSPGRQGFHPSAAKAWVYFTASGGVVTEQASYNVTGVTRNNTGDYTVTWATDFSSANYAWFVCHNADRSTIGTTPTVAAGSLRFKTVRTTDNSDQDPTTVSVVAYGDQ